jgi:hypothetical protein
VTVTAALSVRLLSYRMVIYSGLTNKSAVLYDSLHSDSVPFEGLLSDHSSLRIEFMASQGPAASVFHVRFEGEAGGRPRHGVAAGRGDTAAAKRKRIVARSSGGLRVQPGGQRSEFHSTNASHPCRAPTVKQTC